MANEVKVIASLAATNGTYDFPKVGGSQLQFDQAAQGGGTPGSQNIPTTAGGTVVDVTELTTVGWAYFKNLDSTNYVQHGPESGGVMIPYGRMEPGEPAVFRLDPAVVLRMLANTATCLVQILILED